MKGLAVALAGVLLLVPGAAHAHSAIAGIGGFYNGLLHPIVVPAHLLVLIGLGLWLGQQPLPKVESALLAFSPLLLVGLALSPFELLGAWRTPALLACALSVGLLVAAALSVPRSSTAAIGGLIALLVGLDSTPEEAAMRARVIVLTGVAVGVLLLLLNVVALTASAQKAWLKVGVRVIGSWTAASALLVLALAMRR